MEGGDYGPGDLTLQEMDDATDMSSDSGSEEEGGGSGDESYETGDSDNDEIEFKEESDADFAFEFNDEKFLNEDVADHLYEIAGDEDETGFITIPQLNYNVPWKTLDEQENEPLKKFIRESDGQLFPFDGQVRHY